jgi:hypothetical protein
MGKHYCYRHIRPDLNVPFYIGIGTKLEKYASIPQEYKRAYSKNARNRHWRNILKKCGGKILIEILFESDNSAEIKDKEKEFIKLYGRRSLGTGTLVNRTDGGDGVTGTIISDATRRKMSENHADFSGENSVWFGKKHTDETKLLISKANTGKKRSLTLRAAVGDRNRKRFAAMSQDEYARFKASMFGSNNPRARQVLQFTLTGEFIREWSCIKEAADSLNFKSRSNIVSCCKGRLRHCGGFIWRYKETTNEAVPQK